MKTWPLLIGLIVILAIVCSPVLAISKSDLISYYRAQPMSLYDSEISVSYDQMIQDKSTETQPTVMPFPKWPDSTFLKPFPKPGIPSSPIVKPSMSPGTKICPPAVPARPLYHVMVYCGCTQENPNCDCVNPETGEHYPIGGDLHGNTYIVKPGCQCTWAD